MNKSLKTLFLFNGIFVFASSLFGPLYAVYVEGIDKSVLAVSSSWSAFLFSTTLFTYLMSKWGDKLKETEYFLICGYLIRAIVWIGYIFAGNFYMLIFLQILLGIGESLGTPSYDAIFAEHLDRNKHIRDYSIWKVISNLVGASATLIGGFVVFAYGFVPLFVFMGALALISMLGILLSPRELL